MISYTLTHLDRAQLGLPDRRGKKGKEKMPKMKTKKCVIKRLDALLEHAVMHNDEAGGGFLCNKL